MAKPVNFILAPWLHWSRVKPDEIALISHNEKLTWQKLSEKITKFDFADKNLPIALLSSPENHYLTLLCMLAAWQQGIATLLINSALSATVQKEIIEKTGIGVIFEPQAFLSCCKAQKSDFNIDNPLTLTLTSGSTGIPKAAVHNARQHLFSAQGLFKIMPFSAQDCWLLSLPLYHISGMAIVWRWLAVGAKLKIADYRADNLMQAIQGVTHASLVPTQLQRLVDSQFTHSIAKSLHSVLLGGAAIPQTLVSHAQQQGIRCWCGYGMTEMASTISAKRADLIDSVGKILPFRELKLSKQNEILVKGQTLALGYFEQAKISKLSQNWFATKDLGRWLENNELTVIGRVDNMFISGGESVHPEAIEKVLSHFPNVGQVIVLPLYDKKWGRIPIALVEKEVDQAAFLDFAKEQLANYQVPKKILHIPKSMLDAGIKPSRVQLLHWVKRTQLGEK